MVYLVVMVVLEVPKVSMVPWVSFVVVLVVEVVTLNTNKKHSLWSHCALNHTTISQLSLPIKKVFVAL